MNFFILLIGDTMKTTISTPCSDIVFSIEGNLSFTSEDIFYQQARNF